MRNHVAGVSTAAVVLGVMILSVGGVGVAVAANGGSLTLGQTNHATSTTSLDDPNGTPLALSAGNGKAPFTVNSSKQVTHLNASLVGGLSASQLQTSGAGAATTFGNSEVATLGMSPEKVATTKELAAGTYYVTTTATVQPAGNTTASCALTTADLTGSTTAVGDTATDWSGVSSLAITKPVQVAAGHEVAEWCWLTQTSDPGYLYSAAITAIRIDNASVGVTIPGHRLVATVRTRAR